MKYPSDSIQGLLEEPWWENTENNSIERGTLVKAVLPHIDQVPYTLHSEGRHEATVHNKAIVKIKPLDIKKPKKRSDLPVAALRLGDSEVWAAYRAKKRPCLVWGTTREGVDESLIRGTPKRNTAPTILVFPFYGIYQDGQRAGYSEIFIERVLHLMCPQFYWDILLISNVSESLMRFEHMQPVGSHHNSFVNTGFKLTDFALSVVEEIFQYYLDDTLKNPEDGFLFDYLKQIKQEFYL